MAGVDNESLLGCRTLQPVVKTNNYQPFRIFLDADQNRGQLTGVGSPQGMNFEQSHCPRPDSFKRGYLIGRCQEDMQSLLRLSKCLLGQSVLS